MSRVVLVLGVEQPVVQFDLYGDETDFLRLLASLPTPVRRAYADLLVAAWRADQLEVFNVGDKRSKPETDA